MKYNIDDNEAMYLIKENSEEAKDLLVNKYKYIIDIILTKYKRMAYLLKIDHNDLYQEAMLGFADALDKYRDDKATSLPTFITLCVERKLNNAMKKAGTQKNKMLNDSLSLEQSFNDDSDPLINLISDDKDNSPLENLTNNENYLELKEKIEKVLSESEYEVYELMLVGFSYVDIAGILGKMPKQIDNTIQRIRLKTKKVLDNK